MKRLLAKLNDEVTTTIDAILPPVGKRVIVECEGFRCLAFCDQNGRWVDAFNDQVLPEVLSFKPLVSGGR